MGGVRYDPGGGGSVPLTQFADPFIGAGRVPLAGANYFAQFMADNGSPGVNVDAQLNFSGAGGIFGSGSGTNDNVMRVAFFPSTVDSPSVKAGSAARGAFAQWTLVSRTVGVDCEIGLIVFGATGGAHSGYELRTQSESTNTGLNMGMGTTQYAIRANCFASAPGDVIRMEVRPSAASNEIKVFKNGVLQTTDIDVNALRPTSGLNGFDMAGVFTGVLTMKDFSCGLL